MEVYTDLINGEEIFSSAKKLMPVETKEGPVEGLVCLETENQVDPDCDEDDETAETRLDHFWQYPSVNHEAVEFKKFKTFRDDYFKAYVKGLMSVKKEAGEFKDKDDEKAFQGRMAGIMGWLKDNFGDIDIYAPVSATGEVVVKGKEKELFAGYIYGWFEGDATTPKLVFLLDGYKAERC